MYIKIIQRYYTTNMRIERIYKKNNKSVFYHLFTKELQEGRFSYKLSYEGLTHDGLKYPILYKDNTKSIYFFSHVFSPVDEKHFVFLYTKKASSGNLDILEKFEVFLENSNSDVFSIKNTLQKYWKHRIIRNIIKDLNLNKCIQK